MGIINSTANIPFFSLKIKITRNYNSTHAVQRNIIHNIQPNDSGNLHAQGGL